MKKNGLVLFCGILIFSFFACNKNEEPIIAFTTTVGEFRVKLYKETPQHRDNFLKLVDEGYFNGLIFHKSIPHLLIETGDPNSKKASRNRILGTGGPGYSIPSEINYPQFFHKKGVLTAGRLLGNDTETKASSGSVFGIVSGKVYTSTALDTIELEAYQRKLDIAWQVLIAKNREKITAISLRGDTERLKAFQDSLVLQAEKYMESEKLFLFTPEQRKAYTTVGGAPHLDNEHSIFGEIVSGIEIIDSIAAIPVDINARPMQDIRILSVKRIE